MERLGKTSGEMLSKGMATFQTSYPCIFRADQIETINDLMNARPGSMVRYTGEPPEVLALPCPDLPMNKKSPSPTSSAVFAQPYLSQQSSIPRQPYVTQPRPSATTRSHRRNRSKSAVAHFWRAIRDEHWLSGVRLWVDTWRD